MPGKLNDKVALVTGGGRGLGRAIARTFAGEGARVVVADIDADNAGATAAGLAGESLALKMDVASKASVQLGFAETLSRFGQLDVLVNNAGILTRSSWETCTEAEWDRVVGINLKGTFLCAQCVIAHMKERRQGAIINMTSVAAKTGGATVGPPYGASKAGISALTLNLARELAPYGVRVNGIAPGVIDTPMTDAPEHDGLTATIPLGRKGRPEDIACCALFLASDDASYITGEIIDVNGGLFMD